MIEFDIRQSMLQFAETHPSQKYLFFGGKGGVGKTVMAGAAAVGLAKMGKRTLLASTNPVHSLSGMLNQNVFGNPTPALLAAQGEVVVALAEVARHDRTIKGGDPREDRLVPEIRRDSRQGR